MFSGGMDRVLGQENGENGCIDSQWKEDVPEKKEFLQ